MTSRSKWFLNVALGLVLLFFAQTMLSGYHIAPSVSGEYVGCCHNDANASDDAGKLPASQCCHFHIHLAVASAGATMSFYMDPVAQMLFLTNDICPEGIALEIEHPPQLS